MNRVTKRTWIMGLFILILLGGMTFFLVEYAMNARQWVVSTGSPHVYNAANIGTGSVEDRSGQLLLDLTDGRSYASDELVRRATLHWLGDREGFISAQAVANYAAQMAGFDPVDGVYNYGGIDGVATLTLSARIQAAALEAMGDRKGTVAVYNYKTGEILCAVTTPTYDPDRVPDIAGDASGAYEGVYLNRFLQSAYIPGSIFKVVTTAAALECVPDILDRSFYCSGVYEYGVDKVTCETAHGTRTLRTALSSSCNCSFAQISELIGKENMQKYVQQFGVVESLKFDGITAVSGNYDIADAAPVELAWSCIGQYTDQINPARYMAFMGAIAGGGKAALPHLVSEVRVGEEITYRAETVMSERILSEDIAATLREFMRGNVQNVYGDWNFPGLNVCAKSGTSQLGGELTSNAMFAGFITDEKYPLAFIAVVENGGYGSSACVPVLSRVLGECKVVLDAQ